MISPHDNSILSSVAFPFICIDTTSIKVQKHLTIQPIIYYNGCTIQSQSFSDISFQSAYTTNTDEGRITMKKLTAILFSLAMLTGNLTVAAEDAPTPAKLDDAVIEQLINDWHDKDEDGIISTDEFNSIQYLTLDLTDITDLSFLFDIPHLQALHLSNGSFTNLDMLTKLPNINSLSHYNNLSSNNH